MIEYTTPARVGSHLGGTTPVPGQEVADYVTAANAWARRLDLPYDEPTRLGVTMLAARWYRRRLSPAGIEAITDTGASYVARTDPDIARLLRIDQHQIPRVG